MRSLKQRGLDQALREVIQRGTPVLGICLGMQVSLTHSQENDTPTLNIIPGQVRRFAFDRKDLKFHTWAGTKFEYCKPIRSWLGSSQAMSFISYTAIFLNPYQMMQCSRLLITKVNSRVL
ncbi:MAG: hypothetical protein CM15mP120_27680 [Pseudomonadota bacterium]|nr:MAG: hypothetical protein CM15mP120_27680 [Pseudomonadota bacterium]